MKIQYCSVQFTLWIENRLGKFRLKFKSQLNRFSEEKVRLKFG